MGPPATFTMALKLRVHCFPYVDLAALSSAHSVPRTPLPPPNIDLR